MLGPLYGQIGSEKVNNIYMNTMDKNIDSLSSMSERHVAILEILQEQGSVSVSELSEKLNVSEVTIRKDLTALEASNKLYRTHGRAIPISPYIGDRHINEKEKQSVSEKRAIAKKAASLVVENDSILIASGTTILYAAKEMTNFKNLTAITASVSVSSLLSQNKHIDVVQLGGIVRESSVSVVGSFAESMLGYFNCSKLFMGADGVDLEFGVTTTNMMEANLNRMMMDASQKTVLLVDSSKFGKRGFSKICNLDKIDQIITDDKVPQHYVNALEDMGIEVTIVKM
jgi:DeoR family transcriptional regulator of aga operon